MIEKILSKEDLDFVTEAVTIGSGNAASALSQMLGCNVDLSAPKLSFLSYKEVSSIFEDISLRAIVAKTGLVGDVQGVLFYIVKEGDVRDLVNLIEKTYPVGKISGIPEIAVIEETTNIIAGVYLSSIWKFCGLNVTHAIPVVSSIKLQAVEDDVRTTAKGIIVIVNKLIAAKRRFVTYLLMALSEDALKIFSLKITEARRRLEIKELEEKVVRGEVEFHSIVETASDAIICIKEADTIYLWNKKAEEMFGYSAEEACGKQLHQLIVPEKYREKASEGLKVFYQSGTGSLVGKVIELTAFRRDGTEFPIELNISAMHIKGVWHAAGIIRDITERKRGVERLAESEEMFRHIFDGAVDGILLADSETKKLLTGNPMICRMLGYTSEEFTGLIVSDIHPEQDMPYILEQFERQLRGEIQLASDIPVKRRDGTVFYADIKSSPVRFRGKTYLLGIFRDITESKKAKEQLNLFRNLLEHSSDAIAVVDPATSRFLDINGAACYDLRYTRDELLQRGVVDISPDLRDVAA